MNALDILAIKYGCENELHKKINKIYAALHNYAKQGYIDVQVEYEEIDPQDRFFIKLLIKKLEYNGYNVTRDKLNSLHIEWTL